MDSVDRAIAAIAKRQGGHITAKQLRGLGLSRDAIHHRVRRGLLIAVFRGVYAVGHLPTNPIDRARGALLACGPTAALSHGSAASLYEVVQRWRLPFEVIVSGDRRPNGIRVHRSTSLLPRDIVIHQGVRVTSPALTLLHIAPGLNDSRLTRATNTLRMGQRNQLTTARIEDVLQRFPRHPGTKRLRAVLGIARKEPTRSDLEDDFERFARRFELPPYVLNEHFCGYRVDFYFAEQQLIVETDGWDTHQTKQAFEADRLQDAEILAKTGIPTFRTTRERVRKQSAQEAARLHSALGRRASYAA